MICMENEILSETPNKMSRIRCLRFLDCWKRWTLLEFNPDRGIFADERKMILLECLVFSERAEWNSYLNKTLLCCIFLLFNINNIIIIVWSFLWKHWNCLLFQKRIKRDYSYSSFRTRSCVTNPYKYTRMICNTALICMSMSHKCRGSGIVWNCYRGPGSQRAKEEIWVGYIQ